MKKPVYRVVLIGASEKTDRYSNQAIKLLAQKGHEVFPIAPSNGQVNGIDFIVGQPEFKNIHTLTLYINPNIQKEYYDYILEIKPKRIIFNPGTENQDLAQLAEKNGIETENACTLVLSEGFWSEKRNTIAP